MAGLKLIASSRPTFNGGTGKLTFAIPSSAKRGHLLLALVVRNGATDLPAGWTQIDTLGGGTVFLDVNARMVDVDEPASVTFTAAGQELQGQLLVLEGGTPALAREHSASAAFAATMVLASATATSNQAIDLGLCLWSAGAAAVLTAPAGFTTIDMYSTAIIAPRTLLVAYEMTKVVDNFAPAAAASNVNVTGRSFTVILRDRLPVQPRELYDPVPGNVGLFGRDNRPARSV